MHHGPLWQFFLSTAFLIFAVQRGAIAFAHALSDTPSALAISAGLQALLGMVVVVGVWLGRRWVLAPLVALGVLVSLAAILEGPILGVIPNATALGRVAMAVLVTGGLAILLSSEFRAGETNAERAERSGGDPRVDGARDAPG